MYTQGLKSLLLVFLVLLTFSVWAQRDGVPKNDKAIAALENAKLFFDNHRNSEAQAELDKALRLDPRFIEAHLMYATIYEDSKDYVNAIVKYKEALAINEEYFPNAWYTLAKAEMKIEKFDDAAGHIQQYLTYPNINPALRTDAERTLKNVKFAANAIKNPVAFKPINLGGAVNSKYKEYFPSVSADEQILFFTRTVPTDTTNPKSRGQEDFYYSINKNGKWDIAKNAGSPLNTSSNEGAQCLSPDGQTLFFTICEGIDGAYPEGRKGNGRCDIFFSGKIGDKWSEPRNINQPISSTSWDAQPSLASDGRTIYFISNRKGGYGEMDIWKCFVKDDNTWSEPINLGPKINTSGKEMSVFVHPDNRTLYFSSDGHVGMGKHDLYVSYLDEKGEWQEPVNLGYPINTIGDEWRLVVNAAGNKAYYSSDRPGGYGDLDLYEFELPENVRPSVVSYFKGKVTDFYTKQPLAAKFELIDLATGQQVTNSYANSGSGEFLVCLPSNKDYALNVTKDGYLFYSENFSLRQQPATKPLKVDIAMKPIKVGEKMVLKNIFFETAKFDLKEQSNIELNKLIAFLVKNPTVNIEIAGHTDNVGDKKSNQVLSENRAKTVYNYLLQKQIKPERLTYKGYGDTQPIDVNTTEAGRANNRRTEFVIK